MSRSEPRPIRLPWFKNRLGDRFGAFLVAMGWGVLNAGVTLIGIFQGVLIPVKTYGGGGGLVPLAMSSMSVPLDMRSGGVEVQLDIGPVLGLPFGKLVFFLEILGIAVFASFLIADFQRAIVGLVFSYGVSAALVGFVLVLPGLTGASAFPDVLLQAAVFLTFTALFPIPLFLVFVGTILGVILSEKFFYSP